MLTFDSFDVYKANDALNASFLKSLRVSSLTAITPKEDTKILNLGRMYHAFILEPEKFKDFYCPFDENERPEKDKTMNSNKNKLWKAEQQQSAADKGKQLIKRDEIIQIAAMREILINYASPALNLIKNSACEASIYTELTLEDGTTIKVKARYDCINVERGAILDLKTTQNASIEGFGREAGKFAYHVQAAFYLRIAEKIFNKPFKFFILAQETNAPYNAMLREVSPEMRAKGDYEIDKLIEAAAYVRKTGNVGSYNIFTDDKYGIMPLDIPEYYVNKNNFNFNNKKIA